VRTDSRLFRMLHVLLHMSRENRPLTSEEIAKMLGTNATVVRRTMAALKSEHYVSSEKGHGGGWQLSCNLKDVTLLDVYTAVGKPTIFAIGIGEPDPDCLVEQVVQCKLGDALAEAEAALLSKLGEVSLADLEIELNSNLKGRQRCKR
jgi:Rrf2 family protein